MERSGLLSVVSDLTERSPNISDQKIANILMKDYGDQLEDGKITWFGVRNARKKLDTSKILDSVDDKASLDDVALEEFNRIMKDGADKANDIYERARDGNELGVALKGIEQIRRNWVSMMDFYKKHIIPPIQSITINEDKKVIIVLQKYNELLCANCRERINRELLLEANDK